MFKKWASFSCSFETIGSVNLMHTVNLSLQKSFQNDLAIWNVINLD